MNKRQKNKLKKKKLLEEYKLMKSFVEHTVKNYKRIGYTGHITFTVGDLFPDFDTAQVKPTDLDLPPEDLMKCLS